MPHGTAALAHPYPHARAFCSSFDSTRRELHTQEVALHTPKSLGCHVLPLCFARFFSQDFLASLLMSPQFPGYLSPISLSAVVLAGVVCLPAPTPISALGTCASSSLLSAWPPLAATLLGIAGVTATAAPISVVVSSVLVLVSADTWAAGAACCAPAIGAAAALLPIADVATTAAPAAAAVFPARGPIGVFAAGSARVFPALSSTALPPTSVTVGGASSAVAPTVGVVAAPPAVTASRWVAVLVAKSVSLGPGGLRLVFAPLRARSSAASASTAAWSP